MTVINVDPEVGIFNEDGLVEPACNMFPGKDKAISVEPNQNQTLARRCTVDHDGRAIEFQRFATGEIYHSCIAWMLDGDWWCLRKIVEFVDEYNVKNKTRFRVKAVAEGLTSEEILSRSRPEAHYSGCNTVYDAYNKGRPSDGIPNYRYHLGVYFGNHVHIVGEGDAFKGRKNLIRNAKLYDIISVIPCALLTPQDGVYNRGKYIGAGFFRPKPYGQEFTSHDAALLRSPMTQAAVYHTSRLFHRILTGCRHEKYLDVVDGKMVEFAIENRDHKAMKYIYKQIEEMLVSEYDSNGLFSEYYEGVDYGDDDGVNPIETYNKIIDGEYSIGYDMAKNWGLGVALSTWGGHQIGLHSSMDRLVNGREAATLWQK